MEEEKVKMNNKLTKKQTIGYAMGDLGGCMTFAIGGSFLLPYYTEVAGLSAGAVAIMFLVLKVWDAINDPMMGAIMDKIFSRTHNNKGKFRPWMIRSAPLLLITAILMYTAPTYVDGAAKIVVAYVTYLLYEASYTMFNIPYGSLLSAMSNTEGERAKLSSARGFGSMIGNLIPLILFPIIIDATKATPQLGYTLGITVCGVIGFIACILSCSWTHETYTATKLTDDTPASDVKVSDILVVLKKNRAFWGISIAGIGSTIAQYAGSTLGVYMWRDVLGALPMMSIATLTSMVGSVIILIFAPNLIKKFGLDRTLHTSLLLGMCMYVLLYFSIPFGPVAYILVQTLASICSSLPILMQWGMVGEVIDYNEYITGKRTEGSIYGTFNLTRRFGQAIGSSFAAFMLGVIGYNSTLAMQSAGTILGIKLLVIAVPFLGVVVSFIGLKFVWNITPEIRAKITERRQNM